MTMLMSITAIRVVVNMSNGDVVVTNLEQPDGRDNMTVPANQIGISHKDAIPMYIPWCDDGRYWSSKHINIEVNTDAVLYSIWQQGDYVRYSVDGQFHSNGTVVPGFASTTGERIAVIDKNLQLSFVKLS